MLFIVNYSQTTNQGTEARKMLVKAENELDARSKCEGLVKKRTFVRWCKAHVAIEQKPEPAEV